MSFYLKSRLNGYVLDIPGGNHGNGVQVIMYPKNNPPSDNQLWQLEHQPDGTFLIISKLHGKALDCGGQTLGSKLIVWDRHGGNNQRWRREGHFIVSMSGLMLDIEGNNSSPGAHVLLWTRNNLTSSNQQFEFESTSDQPFKFEPHWQHIQSYLNGYVLDIPGGNHDNGVQVIMYPKNNPPSDNQLWHLEHQPDGTLVMISKLHGKALDCGGQTLGSKLIVWDRHSGPHQQWRREGHFIESMSGFMLDIEGNNPSPGAHVHLWTRNNPTSSNQQFEFVSAVPQLEYTGDLSSQKSYLPEPFLPAAETFYLPQQPSYPPQEPSLCPEQPIYPPQQISDPLLPQEPYVSTEQSFIEPSLSPEQIFIPTQQPSIPPEEPSLYPELPVHPPQQISYPPLEPFLSTEQPQQPSIPLQQPSIPPSIPSQQPSIPPQEPSIPPQEPSIPPQEPSIPPQEPSIPPHQPPIPLQQQSIPPQQPSIPPQQPSIPPQQPSIPPQQPSIPPQQPSIPPQQPSIPPQQPSYTFEGTVKPFAQFDPEADSKVLHTALKGLLKDEGSVIRVLAYRSNQQRQEIKLKYKVLFGKDLSQELHGAFSGKFGKAVYGLMMTPVEFDAYCLHQAIESLGTKEKVLIEILCTRTNKEIVAIKKQYNTMFHHDLEKDVVGDTSGDFKRLLVSMLTGSRDETCQVDEAKARADAERLYQAGEARLGTDESVFNQILASRSFPQLRATFNAYAKLSKFDMEHVIEKEMSGYLEEGMVAIVKCVRDMTSFFAEKLYKSMKGVGTDDLTLVHVIVSRSEVDMVNIKNAFRHNYGQSLGSFIKGDTSGHYEKLLLALVHED